MISRFRPGIGRLTLILYVAAGILVLGAIAFGVQVWGFYQILQKGDTALLSSFQFAKVFTPVKTAAAITLQPSVLASLMTSDDPSLGEANAPLQIVEFADFGCPFSKEESSLLREVAASYPEIVHVQVRDFPIDELHPDARLAASAAACANADGKYWAYHDKLYANQDNQKKADLVRYATEVGLDKTKFVSCLESKTYEKEVQNDYEAGVAVGVQGTPTFFINGIKIEGAIPADAWQKIVSLIKK